MTLNVDFKVTGDALDELCAQLTRDLFAIAKFLLAKDEDIDRLNTLINKNQCEIFNFADLCNWMDSVWSTTRTIFCVKRNILRKQFPSYFLYIYEYLLKY